MNDFIENYVGRLRALSTDRDIEALYDWFWESQDEIAETTEVINEELGLCGKEELKPDLPCLTIGARKGLLVLAANPGWNEQLNALENTYCRRSKSRYRGMMFDFLEVHPKVVGKRVRWWSSPMGFLPLLGKAGKGLAAIDAPEEKWRRVNRSRILGGWQLFPFHSQKDGLTRYAQSQKWLYRCLQESVRAALRFHPQLLLVASKAGWELVRKDIMARAPWKDCVLGRGNLKTNISYRAPKPEQGHPEIVAISRQIFSTRRNFTNEELFEQVRRWRAD